MYLIIICTLWASKAYLSFGTPSSSTHFRSSPGGFPLTFFLFFLSSSTRNWSSASFLPAASFSWPALLSSFSFPTATLSPSPSSWLPPAYSSSSHVLTDRLQSWPTVLCQVQWRCTGRYGIVPPSQLQEPIVNLPPQCSVDTPDSVPDVAILWRDETHNIPCCKALFAVQTRGRICYQNVRLGGLSLDHRQTVDSKHLFSGFILWTSNCI